MDSFNEVWNNVCDFCRSEMTQVAYNSWIATLTPVGISDGKAVLCAKSSFQRNIVTENYTDRLERGFEEVFGFPVKVMITSEEEAAPTILQQTDPPPVPDTLSNYTFDNFIVGSSNRFAHAAAVSVAANPGGAYNPLLIYGNSGLGKTHLLNAIRNEIQRKNPAVNIIYTQGERFTNELIEALARQDTVSFREKYRKADVLFIDDIHFIAGKQSTMEEFFNTFNTLHQDNKQIVVTSDRPPKEIQTLDERIRSRFEMGLLADIQMPDFETRVAIIRRKAQLIHFDLPDEIITFIANQLKHNVRQLEGTVNKLHAFFELTGEQPTVATTMNAIRDIRNDDQPAPVTIEKIIKQVSDTYNVSEEDILSAKRDKDIAGARHVAIYIARRVTQLPLEDIGRAFSGRDHSTVHYSVGKIEKEMKRDSRQKATVEEIIKNVTSQS